MDRCRRRRGSELAAVASRDHGKAAAYAVEHHIPNAYGSYEDLLADPEIDAVYISLPNSMHAEWTIKAAQAGKHVLCEKPLVVSLSELNQVESAAAAAGVTVFEAFMYLHHPQTLTALEMVRSGKLGRLQTINSWFNFYLPPVQAQNVRLQAGLTGGALWDVGVYPNSVSIVMAGRAPRAVWAQQEIGESGVDVAMRAQLDFGGGTVAQISTGFRTPFREGVYLVGEEGILNIVEPWKPGVKGTDSTMIFTTLDGRPRPSSRLPPTRTHVRLQRWRHACWTARPRSSRCRSAVTSPAASSPSTSRRCAPAESSNCRALQGRPHRKRWATFTSIWQNMKHGAIGNHLFIHSTRRAKWRGSQFTVLAALAVRR